MMHLLERFKHIAIEGPIGVGKSTLARRLGAYLGADLLLEQAEKNPFLGRFYKDQRSYAFQTQLFFFFQRVKQMQDLVQPEMFSPGIVSDFMFAKDALFARMNLDDEEYRLYAQINAQMARGLPQPDLIVWLQAKPSTLIERIRRRGIAIEQDIDEAYLERLCDAYVQHFSSHERTPVLTVVTDDFNPNERANDFSLLLDSLAAFEGPRGVLDPASGSNVRPDPKFR